MGQDMAGLQAGKMRDTLQKEITRLGLDFAADAVHFIRCGRDPSLPMVANRDAVDVAVESAGRRRCCPTAYAR